MAKIINETGFGARTNIIYKDKDGINHLLSDILSIDHIVIDINAKDMIQAKLMINTLAIEHDLECEIDVADIIEQLLKAEGNRRKNIEDKIYMKTKSDVSGEKK